MPGHVQVTNVVYIRIAGAQQLPRHLAYSSALLKLAIVISCGSDADVLVSLEPGRGEVGAYARKVIDRITTPWHQSLGRAVI